MDKKYTSIEEQVNYGLNSIDPNEEVTIKTRDLLEIFQVFGELNRFFHQPTHYERLSDVTEFLGNRNQGAYHLIHKMYYELLSKYIPKHIDDEFRDGDSPFDNPDFPYYYRNNSDDEIADGTENIKSKSDFIEFLKNFRTNTNDWGNTNLEDFLEALEAYTKDVNSYYKNMNFQRTPEEASWRVFAQLLNGASIYE
ncbi:DUF7660 family protein [Roseivirga pacifica]|uniref:DUF7660 family protein n=1 Tax=Roseivirga pacifica TaxID=1267423 RepID=UPI00227BD54D|nr:hypothetical protein [Roseivirga pacifica]